MKGAALAELLLRKENSSVKKELIAEHLRLTNDESSRLWHVYEQYSANIDELNDRRAAIFREYSTGYESLTDNRAENLIRRWLEADVEQATLRRELAEELSKVLTGKKMATFLQLERRISTMMEVQLTADLPLARDDA